ncbi:MAG TPA: flavodoxin domain-containing protein [Thermoleophilaceae bacterium]|nr:flavodoxin domain-containing protein [Thermoleophilaceae bacterium]
MTPGGPPALVVYESIYGNTRAVAEAIAKGLGDAPVSPVHEAEGSLADADLVVCGGPTHMHGLTTAMSRRMAVKAAEEDAHAAVEPGATEERGLRQCLRELHGREGARAAAFDTRIDRPAAVTGSAARGIARRLGRHGYEVIGTESFFVEDAEGPLEDGELERARAWGAELAKQLEST